MSNSIKSVGFLQHGVSAVALYYTLASFHGGAAFAQADAASQGASDDLLLEEIVVTAGRREQILQDVPAAVNAVDPATFTTRGLQSTRSVFDYTAGITFIDLGNPGRGTIAARGVPQASATPVFGVYVDDTPLTSNTNFSGGAATFLDGLLLDLERIEIIKGPQGTLFGATSVGGMMRYISKDPALDDFRLSAGIDVHTVENGEWGQTYNGRVSAPIVKDKLGVTLAAYYRDIAGYVDYVDAATGEVLEEDADRGNVEGYSADVLFVPTDDLKLRFKYLKQESETDLSARVQLQGIDGDEALFGEFTSIAAPGPQVVDFEVISGSLEYDFGWATLNATTSGTEFSFATREDFTAAFAGLVDLLDGRDPGTTNSVLFNAGQGAEKFVQEIRLTSAESDNFEWIAGFYYTKEDTFNTQELDVTPAFNLLFADFPSEYEEYAGFGDATFYINDKFDVTAGVRISRNEVTLNFVSSGLLAGETNFESEVINDTVDTYLFAARYRPSENVSLYARVASGYRPPQANLPVIDPFTGQDIAPPIVFADTAWSYELGAKGSNADNTVAYELALWKIDWANFQAPLSANGVTTGGNAVDGLSAHGFEGSLTVAPTASFNATANISYTKSSLNEDEPGLGGLADEDFPEIPNWKGSVQWNYIFPVFEDWDATFGGGLRYQGGYVSAFSQSLTEVPVEVDNYLVADLNLRVSNGRYSFGIYATNLFDARALAERDDLIVGPATDSTAVFLRPRTIGFNVNVDF
ncbi:MAG: TonB-dependent receptor [Kordiimonadaceae bacterium]|nr:TonB-dependent receptor [Kordiimonadaceae bacterium]MBO6568596.1 TonB-dependent receptor [Kordiimonadaceae bacterium]MBO6965428.1 TonB-dependent receptor [Kordiimonadaceae bacterium]